MNEGRGARWLAVAFVEFFRLSLDHGFTVCDLCWGEKAVTLNASKVLKEGK